MIILRQKVYSQWGKEALDAMREAKSAGLSGKEAREWVSMHANKSGNMVSLNNSLGGVGKTKYEQKMIMNNADEAFKHVTNVQNNIAKQEAQRAANRVANKANSVAVKEAAIKARNSGFNKGFNAGKTSAVINKQTALNTWNRMGRAGKVGTVAAGLGATYLIGKGLFGGKKDKN